MKHRPLTFQARCNMRREVSWNKMTEDLWVVANERGYERAFREVPSDRVDKETRKHGRWVVVFAACVGFETDDPEAFERHMAEEHGRKTLSGPAMPRLRRGPRSADGKAFSTKADVETCGGCGLVAEHDGSTATELWWTEHQRGCALAHQAAS